MRLIGRILLIVVGGLYLYLGITSIAGISAAFATGGWENFVAKMSSVFGAILAMVFAVLYILFGIHALWRGIRGKVSFLSFILAAIMIAYVIFSFIQAHNAGSLVDGKAWADQIIALLTPILYSLGILLLLISPKRKR